MNLPSPIIEDLTQLAGFDADAFLQAHQQPAVVSIRLNPAKQGVVPNGSTQVPWCPDGYYLGERPVFTLDPAFHAGAYYVQEPSSMFIHTILSQLVKGRKGLRVLDLCAAPGGKSTLIASALDAESLLISNEVIRARAGILDENMTRWGHPNTFVTCNDPRSFSNLKGYFDIILVDAPCSGSGLFRKDPRALAEWSIDNVNLCANRQERILSDILPALKKDGHLIYATCSFSTAEDEAILDWLAEHEDMAGMAVEISPDWGIVTTNSAKHRVPGYRFMPQNLQGEGFFAAVMKKTAGTSEFYYPKFKTEQDKKAAAQASWLLAENDWVYLKTSPDSYTAIPACHEPDYQALAKHLYFRKAGIRAGMPSQKEWIPDHDVALSIAASGDISSIHLSREEALKFLKKEEFPVPDGEKGWRIVKYQENGLGWVKLLGNRANNYLPKQWRIRMEIEE